MYINIEWMVVEDLLLVTIQVVVYKEFTNSIGDATINLNSIVMQQSFTGGPYLIE